jgi:hypothetical protein
MTFLSILIALVAVLAVGGLVTNDVPRAYRRRQCMGRSWRNQFPESSKEDIRRFLGLFASAFAIKRRNALLFGPNDELLAIYRARYPSGQTPDALEFETLVKDVEKAHHIALEPLWHEHFTLGDLFARLSGAPRDVHS